MSAQGEPGLPEGRLVPIDEELRALRAGDTGWLTRGVAGIGTASLLADIGHEVPTALLPSFLTTTLAPQAKGSPGMAVISET